MNEAVLYGSFTTKCLIVTKLKKLRAGFLFFTVWKQKTY